MLEPVSELLRHNQGMLELGWLAGQGMIMPNGRRQMHGMGWCITCWQRSGPYRLLCMKEMKLQEAIAWVLQSLRGEGVC